MARTITKLKPLEVARITAPGIYRVDDGLYLQVESKTARSWLHRYMFRRKQRRSGLGSYPEVSLADARAKRYEERAQLGAGIDPVEARKAERVHARVRQVKTITFQECGEACINDHKVSWRHPLSVQNWRGSLTNWAYPIIGKLPVQDVDKAAVMRVLEQPLESTKLWFARAKTAEKVRSRIECILDWAKARECRSGENPARWRGNLAQLLPAVSKVYKSKHLAALPWPELPEFMQALRSRKQNTGRWEGGSVSARALEFVILTAGRRKEVTEARWEEINFAMKIWTVPARRMKAEREQRVPLSPAAIALLEEMQAFHKSPSLRERWQRGADRCNEFIFPGIWRRGGVNGDMLRRVLSAMGHDGLTVHGFRATFRTWADDCTNYPDNVKEMALAHAVGNETKKAYARSDLLEKRRRLMDAWADYCAGVAITADVIPMRAEREA